MNTLEKKYLIDERSQDDVSKYGSVESAINHLKKELEEMESLWSKDSSECLGHGITCVRLKIRWLEKKITPPID